MEDEDSRKGDNMDDEVISLGSDASRVERINQEMEQNAPTWTEQYNEYKCQQGYQQRLEDAELPDNLQDEEVFDQTKQLHRSQMAAMEDGKEGTTENGVEQDQGGHYY